VTTSEGRDALGACRRVLLDADVEELATRLGGEGGGRPLLAGDVRARLDALAGERSAHYRQLAQLVVPTGGRSVEAIAATIAAELGSWAA
jgi:shikimate kinase